MVVERWNLVDYGELGRVWWADLKYLKHRLISSMSLCWFTEHYAPSIDLNFIKLAFFVSKSAAMLTVEVNSRMVACRSIGPIKCI